MPSSRFEPSPTIRNVFPGPGATVALVLGVLLVGAAGCNELNPDFDPDGGPICSPGERRCSPDAGVPEVCQTATSWTVQPACWTGSGCTEGQCLPSEPFERCDSLADCTDATDVCTVFVDPDRTLFLATFCVDPPFPGGRPGGQACSAHEDCASGWCFRRVCFEACTDASHCTNVLHECAELDVTVDGVRDNNNIQGCVPPSP